MKTFVALTALVSLATGAAAHTIFQELHVNGVSAGKAVGIRVPEYNGPITDVNSNDIICNGGINPYRRPVSQAIIDVPAGARVTAEWHHTLDGNQPNNPADPIDPSHKGPVMAYLAQVPSATQTNVSGLKWFKIYQDGYNGGTWGVDKLIRNRGKMDFTIPSCIPSGEYLLRVELIALHGAQSYPGAQFYMECAQIRITGGGNVTPSNTVSFPGAYKGSDPGVRFNLYQGATSYTIPGPDVWTCPAGAGPTQTQTQAPPVTQNPVPTTTTVVAPTPSAPAGPTVPAYGQCGGQGYSGATTCVAGTTCTKLNDWYSQCV